MSIERFSLLWLCEYGSCRAVITSMILSFLSVFCFIALYLRNIFLTSSKLPIQICFPSAPYDSWNSIRLYIKNWPIPCCCCLLCVRQTPLCNLNFCFQFPLTAVPTPPSAFRNLLKYLIYWWPWVVFFYLCWGYIYTHIHVPCCAELLSHVQLFVSLWTIIRQTPLSMGILHASILEWVAMPSSRDLPNPEIEPRSPALQADSLPSEPPDQPKNTGVGSLSLLQGIFLTQQSNWGFLHCRWILYQLSSQGSTIPVYKNNVFYI